jgi:hypothetical protein
MSIIYLYIIIHVRSASEARSHRDIHVRVKVVLDIYMHVVRINVCACKYVYIDS